MIFETSEDLVVLLAGHPSEDGDGVRDDWVLGVYSEVKDLIKGVDYWIDYFKEHGRGWENLIIHYRVGRCNATHVDAINGWDWAFIPKGTNPNVITAGGGCPYKTEFYGYNLLKLAEAGIEVVDYETEFD